MKLDLPIQHRFKAGSTQGRGHSPLLVVLHGRGDSPKGFSWLPDALGFSDLSYVFLQAPDDYYTGYSWYDLPPHQGPGILRSRMLLERTFEQLWTQGFSDFSTLLLGFSQGCLMTLEFGARYEKRLAGYVGISGYCYDEKQLALDAQASNKTAPWLITHGTHDEVLPIQRTREQMQTLIQSGFQITYREYDKSHTIDDRLEFPEIRKFIESHLNLHHG